MKTSHLAIALALAVTLTTGTVFGQSTATAGPQQPTAFTPYSLADATTASLQQPTAFTPAAFEYADDVAADCGDNCCGDTCCGDSCGNSCCNSGCNDCGRCCPEYACTRGGWGFGGWVQQGITLNGYDPADGYNGVIGLNDLANQYQANQMWLFAENAIDDCNCGWDAGGRVDVVYGTDGQFLQMLDGLEEDWDQTATYYQFALFRFYLDIAYNDLTLRMGRFDAPVGFEPYEATESFFYSKSYNFLYGAPGSLFGMELIKQLNNNTSVLAGIHRGSDQFDDTDGLNTVGFVGGISWENCNCQWFDFYVIADEVGPGNTTIQWSVVGGTPIGCWDYAVEWFSGYTKTVHQCEWYGVNQHLTRCVNDCWSYGMRFEWFRDDDGYVVSAFRPSNPAQGPFVGDFYELTFAVNYEPCCHFALRPEIRWDWYEPDAAGGAQPFDDQTRNNQFVASLDAIWSF